MKNPFLSSALIAVFAITLTSCHREDPGPEEFGARDFTVTDYDRIEASDAFDVTIIQGTAFVVIAQGDVRNLDDLSVSKKGSTLVLKYNNGRNRHYRTSFTITMPSVVGFTASGAATGRMIGFVEAFDRIDLNLSGASEFDLSANAGEVHATLSGASKIDAVGTGDKIVVDISGASTFTSYGYPVSFVESVVSGASTLKVHATVKLTVNASGASDVRYRGSPQVDAQVSGASHVRPE